jgi:hypothetical protein
MVKAKLIIVLMTTLIGVIFVSIQPHSDTLASIQNSPRPTATNIPRPTARPETLEYTLYLPIIRR